jgi:hypothetical protein
VSSGNQLEWRAGVFNGNGRSNNTNDNTKYQYDARLMWQLGGRAVGYSEVDFESVDKPLLAIAGQFEQKRFRPDRDHTPLPVVTACPCVNGGALKRTMWGVDLVYKFKRVFVMGALLRAAPSIRGADRGDFQSNGYHAQVGYLLDKGRHWELAARYAAWDPSNKIATNDRIEWGFGLNYFYNRHFLKVQSDFRQLEDSA